jgi:ABC-type spermidine/putrescine transport system permease subunit II
MLSLLVALIVLFLGFPLIVIVVLSFNAAPDLVFPPKALSLDLWPFSIHSVRRGAWYG